MITRWDGGVDLPAVGGKYATFGATGSSRLKVKRKPVDPDDFETQQKIQDFLNRRSNQQHHLYLRELERLHLHHVANRIPQLQWQ